MIFSWFTPSSLIQTHDTNQEDQLQLPSTTTIPLTKEEDGWIQVITTTKEQEETDQQVPDGSSTNVNDKVKNEVTTIAAPTIEPKKMSRQQRRYQARLAQQQALKKQKQVAGEEQLKTALKLGQQRKSRQKQWVDQWIPHHANAIAPDASCLPTRSTTLTTGLD